MSKEPKISSICFPNTVWADEQNVYDVRKGYRFERIEKAGEMANICWFQVFDKAGDLVAEIKESVCNIYYERPTND